MLEDIFSRHQKTATALKTEELQESLRLMIADGRLKPGEKLREVELATRFSISRTPVREALVALEREGLVTYELNRGFSVRHFSFRDLYEAYEMRAVIEGYICGLIAQQGVDDDTAAKLRRCVTEVDNIVAQPDELDTSAFAQWRELNLEFHAILMSLAPGDLIRRTHAMIGRMPRMHDIFNAVPSRARQKMAHYNVEHTQILDAIIQRQSGRAEFLMREHIMQACTVLREHLKIS